MSYLFLQNIWKSGPEEDIIRIETWILFCIIIRQYNNGKQSSVSKMRNILYMLCYAKYQIRRSDTKDIKSNFCAVQSFAELKEFDFF